jgi:hypothetical protein
MKWSRLVYCAAIVALTTILVMRGTTVWLIVPLAAFAAWWTFICTRALWSVATFHVAARRLSLAPSLSIDDLTVPVQAKRWEWLSNPRLDGLVSIGTLIVVFGFPALLWLPLVVWLIYLKK